MFEVSATDRMPDLLKIMLSILVDKVQEAVWWYKVIVSDLNMNMSEQPLMYTDRRCASEDFVS